jgi:hypothetical protein
MDVPKFYSRNESPEKDSTQSSDSGQQTSTAKPDEHLEFLKLKYKKYHRTIKPRAPGVNAPKFVPNNEKVSF